MALLRVRHPGAPPKDVPLGPAVGRFHPWRTMRQPIDEAIVRAATLQRFEPTLWQPPR